MSLCQNKAVARNPTQRGEAVKLFFRAPETLRTRATIQETWRVYDMSEGVSTLDAGHLAKVLRVRGVLRETGNGWGEGTTPYQAQSMNELRQTIQLRRAK